MTAPRLSLLQLQHPKEAAFLLGLVQRLLEGTVWLARWDGSGPWVQSAKRGGLFLQKMESWGAYVKSTISESRGEQAWLAALAVSAAEPRQPSSKRFRQS